MNYPLLGNVSVNAIMEGSNMTHRSFTNRKLKIPSLRSFRKQCYQFKMDYSIVEDFYNLLIGRGGFYDFNSASYKNQLITALQEKKIRVDDLTISKQLRYDKAAQKFVEICIAAQWVQSTTIESDLLKLNEIFQAGFKDYKADQNIDTCTNNSQDILPDFTGGLPPSTLNNKAEATNYLRDICNDDYIDDIRLYSPKIQEGLLKVRDLSQTVRASLVYNKGTAKRDTNEKTDFAQQRSCKSLQEVKFLARSEYAYPTNTRLNRLATGQAQVLVPQKKARKKFARFLLLDCSGSMQYEERIYKAAAVLLDSIESVVKHGDILHVAFFGDDFIYKGAVTKENAHNVLLSVCNLYNYYTENECNDPLQQAWTILQENPDLQKLEIILLSDGLISGFQTLSSDCECKVHFIDLSGNTTPQYEIQQTVDIHNGTITKL